MKKKSIILISFLIFIISCSTSISSIRKNPSDYNGKVIRISGDVTEKFSIPATGTMIYLLYDGTGTIPVFTINKRKIGDNVSADAMVFAVVTKGAVNNVDAVIEKIIDYLKENNIIKGKLVNITGKAIAKLIKVILAKTEGSYLLVEVN